MKFSDSRDWWGRPLGIHEISRTLKSGGNLVLRFAHHSGQSQEGVEEKLHESGFIDIRLEKGNGHFYFLAAKRKQLN